MRNDYLNLIQNELLQDGFIFYRAIRRKEPAINALHGMVAEEQYAEGHFVDLLAIEPVRPHRIARSIFAHRHTSFLRCCDLSMWSIWPHGFCLPQQVDKRPLLEWYFPLWEAPL